MSMTCMETLSRKSMPQDTGRQKQMRREPEPSTAIPKRRKWTGVYTYGNGAPIRGSISKSDRKAIGHTHGQTP